MIRTLVIFVVILIAGPAGAQPAEQAARLSFEKGRALYAQGRYREALAEFSTGFELSGRPLFLFNMAECARLAGDPTQARTLYRRFLDAGERGDLAVRARARLDALPPEPTPPPAPPPVPVIRIAPVPPPPIVSLPPPPPRRSLFRRWPFWAAVGGVVVVGSLTAFALTRSGGGDCASCPVVDLR